MRRSLVAAACVLATVTLTTAPADATPKRTTAKITARGAAQVVAGRRLTFTITARAAKRRHIISYALSFGDKTRSLRGHRLTTKVSTASTSAPAPTRPN